LKAFVVVDLGFGDSGKGLMTDYLVRRHEARLVVRFNGGAQAGHNVVEASGRQHTFSQFGSGTFVPGVRTHLANAVVVHPTALRVEAERLAATGIRDALSRLSVDPGCRVTTPFQQAAGRLRELLRGGARHGSCGVGVGETVSDSLAAPELTLRFGELRQPERVRERLAAQRQEKLREFAELAGSNRSASIDRELNLLKDATVEERWLPRASEIARAVQLMNDDALRVEGSIVFEGAQGVLLDEDFGFHPFTTYSRCVPEGARGLLARIGWSRPVETIGVLRSYAVRHGPGPLPTEDAQVAEATAEPHNTVGTWQGAVRKGWLDLVLVDYALRACGVVDALALTHLDALRALAPFRWCERYSNASPLELPRGLSEQERLTGVLLGAAPCYSAPDAAAQSPERLCEALFQRLGVDVRYGSVGATASAVFERPGVGLIPPRAGPAVT
jgi:adenylosuccinate synthase